MNDRFDVGNYLPHRPPTWLEVFIVVAGTIVTALSWLSSGPSSLPAVALGASSTVLSAVAGARTRTGQQVGRWWEEIGVHGRAIVVVLFVILSIAAFRFETTPRALVLDFGEGLMIGGILLITTHMVYERRVEGWI